MRVSGLGLMLLLVAAVPNIRAQEAEVSAAVHATLEAWAAGDFETFVGFYHPDARGFFLDGRPLIDGFSVDALQVMADAGFQANVEVQDLDVQMHGGTAMSVGYLVG
jgi:ketosteroid isomerase-like protein